MSNKPHRRKSERFPMEFVMEVSAKDINGNKYNEKTILKDISMEGAKFISRQAGKYFPGQLLEITIFLPETDDVKVYMKGKATVVWTASPSDSGIGDKGQEIRIGIKMETRLHFERVDAKTHGSRREPQEKL